MTKRDKQYHQYDQGNETPVDENRQQDFGGYRLPEEDLEDFPNYYDSSEEEEVYYDQPRPNIFRRSKNYYSSKVSEMKEYSVERIQELKDYYSEDNDSRWRYYQQSARTDVFIKKVIQVVIVLAIISAILYLLNVM